MYHAMIGKHIYMNPTVETDMTDIIHEVLHYIEDQRNCETLHPIFYYDVLLFISEALPHIDNQDKWIEFGYMLCKDLKHNLEEFGFKNWPAMFEGLGYQCFAVNAFCKQAKILKGFSQSLNQLLFVATKNKLEKASTDETYEYHYDAISGVSGTLYYLLDCEYTEEEKQILMDCIKYLLALTKDSTFCGQPVINFHILQANQNKILDQDEFKDGSINFGLAHGMLGPLIALAKAYAKGFILDGLQEGIEKIFHLYETFQSVNENHVPLWPRIITVQEYWQGICEPEHLHIPSSWCYGNVGTIRGLQKVCRYMQWKEAEQCYTQALEGLFSQDIPSYHLERPSLCHGFSSLVAIQTNAYFDCQDPKLLRHLERNVMHVVSTYRKNNEHKVNLADIRNKTNQVEGYLEDLSLLTGSTGVAIALLSLQRKMETGRLLMID